ncbi:hypothetical protein JCM8097_002650 [Rhodosporidiobolus ruineniae]
MEACEPGTLEEWAPQHQLERRSLSAQWLYNNSAFVYTCPDGTADDDQWLVTDVTDLDLGKEGGLSPAVRTTRGASCQVESSFYGTWFHLDGSYGEDGSIWGCSPDNGASWTWYSSQGLANTHAGGYWEMCAFSEMTDEQHTIILKNSPAGKSEIMVQYIAGGSVDGTSTATLDGVIFSTTSAPKSVTLSTASSSTQAPSTTAAPSSSSSDGGETAASSSSLAATSTAFTGGTTLASSISLPSSSSSSSDNSSSDGLSPTTIVGLIASIVGGIVVVALVAALCLRTKPKKGNEEAEADRLLKSREKRLQEDEPGGRAPLSEN